MEATLQPSEDRVEQAEIHRLKRELEVVNRIGSQSRNSLALILQVAIAAMLPRRPAAVVSRM